MPPTATPCGAPFAAGTRIWVRVETPRGYRTHLVTDRGGVLWGGSTDIPDPPGQDADERAALHRSIREAAADAGRLALAEVSHA